MTDLVTRVSLSAALVTVALTAPAAWLAGVAGGLGVAAGGALAIANLWWLSRRAQIHGDRGSALWVAAVGVRLLALALVVAALLVSGWVHPVALVAGLSVLPPVLIAAGLRTGNLAS